MSEQEFREAVEKARQNAVESSENAEGGDPATYVTPNVDGRCTFSRRMKEYGDENTRGGYEIAGVTLTQRGTLNIDGVSSRLHKKELAAYNEFERSMNEQGYNTTINIDITAK